MREHPLTVELVDESTGTTAKILVGLGLNCYSFCPMIEDKPLEVLWSEPEFASGAKRPSGSGIPLMFPFPGRLRGKSLEYAGKTNMFRGSVSLAEVPEGAYLIVVATDPDRENFGSSKKLKIGAH